MRILAALAAALLAATSVHARTLEMPEAPDAPVQRAGDAAASAIPDERLDMLGLKVGASHADFVAWAEKNGFAAVKMKEPWGFVTGLDFSARADGLLPSRFTPKPWGDFHPMPIAGGGFDCKSELDKEKLCGTVQFSPEPTFEAKRILSMRMNCTEAILPTDAILRETATANDSSADSLSLSWLRRELARMKAERDILKKAAAYFARDSI